MIRVREIVWRHADPADRDIKPRAVGLHVADRVVDRIGIGVWRVQEVRAVDERHIRIELPIIGRKIITPLPVLPI